MNGWLRLLQLLEVERKAREWSGEEGTKWKRWEKGLEKRRVKKERENRFGTRVPGQRRWLP